MFVLGNSLTTWSVKYISSGLASLISSLYPLCVVIIEMLFLKKNKNTPLTFVGLTLGITGVGVVFYENAFHNQPAGYGFGITLGFIAVTGWSIGTLLIARNRYEINPYYAIGWQMFIGSFMIFSLAAATHNLIPLSAIPFPTWAAIAYLIFIGSIVAFIAFIYTIKHLPPAIASLYAYINPMITILVGAWLLHEPISFNLLIGAVITITGVYLVNFSMKRSK